MSLLLSLGMAGMDGTVSGTVGSFFEEVLSRLDQWSFWGMLLLLGVVYLVMKCMFWLLGEALNKRQTWKTRAIAGGVFALILAVGILASI